MRDLVLDGDIPVEIVLRRSKRARRITLRVSALDGRVTLTLPHGVREAEALAFARDKEDWIRGHLARHVPQARVGLGSRFPFEGRELQVLAGDGRRVRLEDGCVYVPGDAETIGARLEGFLKARSRERLAEASDRYSVALGKTYSRLSLRDTRSRWGSCSSEGRLMYSWRLVLAPPRVLEYVAAHEVSHLAEMNHSPRFWAVVERLFGDYAEPRRWLRENGGDLHAFRFKD